MEDSIGKIGYGSNRNSIVMRILRSAMDRTREKLRFEDGSMEFLHEQTTLYELAAILVEGCLEIVEDDESEILESRILSDLSEIRQRLVGRIRDMKQLIREKDREFRERLEKESSLCEALKLRERKSAYMCEEIEPGVMKKNIEQKLEDEYMNTKRRARRSRAFCPNLIVRSLSKESGLVLSEDEKTVLNERRVRRSHSDPNLSSDSLDKRKARRSYASSPNLGSSSLNKEHVENDEFMSSNIDILKHTLDLVFERMQLMDVLPLEKEWRRGVEREVESVSFKGFVRDLQKKFDIELKKRDKLVNDSWFDFIDEMKSLFHELKDFFSRHDLSNMQSFPDGSRRTNSEPNLDVDYAHNLFQNDDEEEDCGSPHVWEIVKSHESIIQKQREQWNMLTKDALQREALLSWIKRNEEINAMERRIQDAIVRLENIAQRKHKVSDLKGIGCINRAQEKRRNRIPKPHRRVDRASTTIQSFEDEIKKLQEERDGLCFQISVIEDTYQLLFRGLMKDLSIDSRCREKETASDEAEGSDTNQIMMHYMESAIKDDIFVLVLQEMVKQWETSRCDLVRGSNVPQDEICFSPAIIQEYTESLLREEIYMIYFKEMTRALQEEIIEHRKISRSDSIQFSKTPQEDFHCSPIQDCTECLLREEIYKVYFREMTKAWRSQESKQFDLEAQTPPCKKVQEGMPLSGGGDGDLSLIDKDCEETEELNMIEWLITDDESTFCSVSEKLERSLQQLYTSKELLAELEEGLELSNGGDEFSENSQFSNVLRIQEENTSPELELEGVGQTDCSENVLAIIKKFRFLVDGVEVELHKNLESKFLR